MIDGRGIFAELKRRNVFRVAVAYVLLAWVVQQVADVFFPALNLPYWSVRLVAGLLIVGFPLAIFFAWAFELTPDGIRREQRVPASESISHSTGRKLDFLIIGVLAVVVIVLLADRFAGPIPADLPEDAATPRASIAVMPFVNLSGDEANEYFSDGVAEEILNALVQIRELRILSRSSSFAFKGKDVPLRVITEELGVSHVVAGSVRESEGRVRIAVQLIEAANDSNVWSKTFERDLAEVFEIQKEISTSIARTLEIGLDAEQAESMDAGVENINAYQRFLEGRYLVLRRGKEGEAGLRRSIELFNEAINLEPGYARAYAGLAMAYTLLPGYSNAPNADAAVRAEKAIEQALNLAPESGEAYATLGLLRANQLRWTEADTALSRAIELTPTDAQALMWYGTILVCSGRTTDALPILLRANDIDPYSPLVAHWLADAYRNLGDSRRSLDEARRSVDLGMQLSAMGIYMHHLANGDPQAAQSSLEESLERQGLFSEHVAPVVAAIEDRSLLDAAAAALAEAEAKVPIDTFWMYFDLDAPDLLFDELARQSGDNSLRYYRFWEPQFSALRQHDRFGTAVEEAGLVAYWRDVAWPDLCQPTDSGFACD